MLFWALNMSANIKGGEAKRATVIEKPHITLY